MCVTIDEQLFLSAWLIFIVFLFFFFIFFFCEWRANGCFECDGLALSNHKCSQSNWSECLKIIFIGLHSSCAHTAKKWFLKFEIYIVKWTKHQSTEHESEDKFDFMSLQKMEPQISSAKSLGALCVYEKHHPSRPLNHWIYFEVGSEISGQKLDDLQQNIPYIRMQFHEIHNILRLFISTSQKWLMRLNSSGYTLLKIASR